MSPPSIVWLRRDLRLADQPAFHAAAQAGPVIPVYVLDDKRPGDRKLGGAARWWLHGSLDSLAQKLAKSSSRLILRRGDAVQEIAKLARETGADTVHAVRHYEPWWRKAEDELAAEYSGVNTVIGKLQAFAVGASIAGVVGVVNAAKITIVAPDQFRFAVSISALAAVVLGGMGNTIGVATGAFIIYLFQSILLKQLNTLVENFNIPILNQIDFLEFQYVLYGIVLVLMMLKRPQWIFPARRRVREFAPLKVGKGGLK